MRVLPLKWILKINVFKLKKAQNNASTKISNNGHKICRFRLYCQCRFINHFIEVILLNHLNLNDEPPLQSFYCRISDTVVK